MVEQPVWCALWYSAGRDRVRMTEACINPFVRLGTQRCQHYLGKKGNGDDVTEVCPRARAMRALPPIEAKIDAERDDSGHDGFEWSQ